MSSHKTSAQLKDMAKNLLAGRYGTAILLLLASGGIPFFLGFFRSMLIGTWQLLSAALSGAGSVSVTGGSIAVSYLSAFVLSLFTGILDFGVTLFYLKAACGQRNSVFDLFYGYQHAFGRVFCINAVFTLGQAVCLYPVQILNDLYRASHESRFLMLALAAGLAGFALYIPLALALSQTYPLMLDFPQYGWSELLFLSVEKMKGHKLRLLKIELSFLPLYLLAFCSLGIGLLWVIPLRSMARILFYLDLMNPSAPASDSAASEDIR